MFTRRIAVSACALCLAVPAAAGAQPAHDQPAPAKPAVAYGDTKYDLQNQQELGGVTGDTKSDLKAPTTATTDTDKVGSLSAEQLAAAYGTDRPKTTPVTASVGQSDDGTNEWQIAAFVEGGLLAAFVVGSGLALTRMRPRRAGLGV
jgi:hypothetical protein